MYYVLDKLLLLLNILPDSLERARTRTRVSVQDVLLIEVERCFNYMDDRAYAHMEELFQESGSWGASLFKLSVDSVIERARRMVHPTFLLEGDEFCQNSRLKELRESAGLCLSCVRAGNVDAGFPCNFDH